LCQTYLSVQKDIRKLFSNIFIFKVSIVELDLIFEEHIEALKEALKELEYLPKWDMLFLGANVLAPIHQIAPHVGKMTGAYCAHAYVVNAHFFDKMLEYKYEQFKAYDEYIFNEMRNPNYNIYAVLPIIATQYESYSNIEGKDVNYRDVLVNSYKGNINKILELESESTFSSVWLFEPEMCKEAEGAIVPIPTLPAPFTTIFGVVESAT
jgi:hypothetical protein